MEQVRPLFIPPVTDEPTETGTLILRDGTTATLRLSTPSDRPALRAFVDRLPPEARDHRALGTPPHTDVAIDALCDSSDPRRQVTLLVSRVVAGTPRLLAVGSYVARDVRTAEVAMAVDPDFHRKGLGALLLERLALLAIRHGFVLLSTTIRADNRAMREVLRESGFDLHEVEENGDLEVALSVLPTERSVARSELRDRIATAASLHAFFHPRSVAVIGASRRHGTIGNRLVEALQMTRYQGRIVPINPHATRINGLPAFPSVTAVPDPVDLAIIAVPPERVLPVVDECAIRGVRALLVITAGFAEVGPEGRALQDRLVEKVRGHGMRLVGPNCMGLLNTDPEVRLNATFVQAFPPHGRVAMLSQSGAVGLAVLRTARHLQLGLSTFISVGNKADVSANDLLQYWEEDQATEVILLYLESFGNPRRFARLARRVGRRKPIVAVKAGRTAAGSRAAGSHTAALAASDVGADALFQQTGIIRADTLDEMFALASLLGSQPLPPGRRVTIVTNAGGPGILCADACEGGRLIVPELSPSTRATLDRFLPRTASRANPVDLIASAGPDEYRQAVTALLADPEVDAAIVIYIPVDETNAPMVAEGIRDGVAMGRRSGGEGKPVLLCWMAEGGLQGPLTVGTERIPVYPSPEHAANALSKVATYVEWRAQPQGTVPDFPDMNLPQARMVCTEALRSAGAGWLSAEDVRVVLTAAGLPLPPGGVARSADEAAAMASRIGYPVAVKLASRRIVHKTDVGGVRLGLTDEAAVRLAVREMEARLDQGGQRDAMEGVLVQPMLTGGAEVMVGMTHDAVFGPLIAFGLGGVHVEILRDVQFRITPLTDRDAATMVRRIRGYRLLTGYRDHPPADLPALEQVLLRISRLVEELPEISELDLNPVFAFPPGQGCRIVDARIRVG